MGSESESDCESFDATLPRKVSTIICIPPVPRTNTRGQRENLEASEITIAKELCKITS